MKLHNLLAGLGPSMLVAWVAGIPNVRAEQGTCAPNQAVYARDDGREFIVRHVGVLGSDTQGTRYLEGELDGEKIAFVTAERPSDSRTAGKFTRVLDSHYAREARYVIRWIEKPTQEVDRKLYSSQGPAWKGEWSLVRCDGKSARAAKAIEATQSIECPIDRAVFIDEKTGRRFSAERYAEDFVFVHEGGESRRPPKGKNGEYVWSKRVGYWLVQGKIEGAQAYLRYEQIQGAPCCTFSSHYPGESELISLKPKWLNGKAVPVINSDNRDAFTPDEIDTRMGAVYQMGPLTGMRLVPVGCSAKTK